MSTTCLSCVWWSFSCSLWLYSHTCKWLWIASRHWDWKLQDCIGSKA